MKYIDRDLSWVSFNARILQEIADQSIPLMERLNFIAIYSSNLEEFYKVRVASHRFEQKYNGDKKNKFGYRPSYVLQQINTIVSEQQEKLGNIFYTEIIPGMEKEGITFLHQNLSTADINLVSEYFDQHLKDQFSLFDITNEPKVELKNQVIYLYFITDKKQYLLELDYDKWGRFIMLSQHNDQYKIVQLDDIFKYNVSKYLDNNVEIYAIKISRDAELYIDEEQDEDIVKKIQKSLKKRETGLPCRLLFNENIPFKHINNLRKKMGLDMTSLIPGGKYHNFYDFFSFPTFNNKPHLYRNKPDYIPCPELQDSKDYFNTLAHEDIFLSYPYQSFEYVITLLNNAASDPDVTEINITLYRVNKNSKVCEALERAAQNGKKVFMLCEVLARFDEESNIYWGERLERAGATVKYGIKNLKVHAKTFLIKRRENNKLNYYAYIGTGNLNEKTAKLYADHAILTSDTRYTNDIDEVFNFLKDELYQPKFNHLLVAPFTLQSTIDALIDQEIAHAKQGFTARMMIKLNSLEDPVMIDKIRLAGDNGVKIDMVVRGICCYYPLTKKQKQNIKIISVIDQFLEHTRIYHFYNNGNPQTYLASADWMTRNLYKRIEVAFPVFKQKDQNLLCEEINYQLNDNLKGRIISNGGENIYVSGNNIKSSQLKMFDLVQQQ
ncbi:polyphosphate kinase 1 [Plebeiibacterium sediminum]|uniref:Polyphosphate kinase n=1 Tax=Plebeiibacterium sediminum TaxID=2992112 RepID=A0AAE3M6A4_9BACT|nr:polyphosphate kinase 1 [Plebeiobacterium sediminum]MCW3787405.1 polyphosphate kinase 1 [Plebeiobacterium sediminum]